MNQSINTFLKCNQLRFGISHFFNIPTILLLSLSFLFYFLSQKVGEFSNPAGEALETGNTFRLDLDTALGDSTRVNLPHPEIIGASEVGHTLMVDDGKVKLTVIEKGDDYLVCNVDVPGKISNRKGVNTPDSILEISPLTPKDRSDLDYMLEIGVDWIALSFVQKPEDILEIREIVNNRIPEGESKPSIMAKIEKPSCFEGDNLSKLVELCDGIMVARGVSFAKICGFLTETIGCFCFFTSKNSYHQ